MLGRVLIEVGATPADADPRLPLRARDRPRGDKIRLVTASIILICLSSAPYMSVTRWLTDVGLGHTAWPFVYTYWIPAAVGSCCFVRDVVGRLRAERNRRRVVAALAAPGAFAIWVLASALWTTSPATTPSESLLAVLVMATAAWFGLALPSRVQIYSIFLATHVLTIGSLAAVMLVPSARSSSFVGDKSWIGLFGNPNSLGPIATFGVLSTLGVATWPTHRRWRPYLCAIGAVDVVVAVGATSVTAWLALIGCAASVGLLGILALSNSVGQRRGSTIRWLTTMATILGVVVVIMSSDALTRLVGKDPTLSGRTIVWRFVVDSLESRWLIGFGFGSFWDDPARRTEYMSDTGLDWVLSSHSTFADTLLYLGVIGLTLLIAVVAASIVMVGRVALHSLDLRVAWWSGVLVFALVENLAESMMLMHSTFWFLLLVPGFALVDWAGRPLAPDPTQVTGSGGSSPGC